MKELYLKLKQMRLFSSLDEEGIKEALVCLDAKVRHYKKSNILMISGAPVHTIGIVLSGSVEISRVDLSGNRLIINQLQHPAMFGEALACADIDLSPVTLTAMSDTNILLFDFNHFLSNGAHSFKYYNLLIRNMLSILAEKNIFLQQRLELLSKKNTRAKLCTYLFHALNTSSNNTIEIPYNRIQLADYLGVNRSAMSKELCKMRDEGLIAFRKNRFVIKDRRKILDLANQSATQ